MVSQNSNFSGFFQEGALEHGDSANVIINFRFSICKKMSFERANLLDWNIKSLFKVRCLKYLKSQSPGGSEMFVSKPKNIWFQNSILGIQINAKFYPQLIPLKPVG
jgi:hypothetical protein